MLVTIGTLVLAVLSRQVRAETPAMSNVRNLSLAGASRSSSTGTQAAFVNPAGVSFSQQFSADAMYQLGVAGKQNGVAVAIHDSLNNPRIGIALTYSFMKGLPEVRYVGADLQSKRLTLQHFGHEAAGVLGVTVIRNWLYLGTALKYQYTSLRYRDDYKKGQQILPALNAFGLDVGAALEILSFARISVVAYNLLGNHRPAYDEKHPLILTDVASAPNTAVTSRTVSRLSDYPLMIAHSLALFPIKKLGLSINYDGTYDLTSYRKSQHYTRMTQAGGVEIYVGPVPLRVGSRWDSMGKGSKDDRVFVGGGIGYIRPASAGTSGFEFGIGVLQQVSGRTPLDTQIGINAGLRLHPDL